jgi:hypothetical protein
MRAIEHQPVSLVSLSNDFAIYFNDWSSLRAQSFFMTIYQHHEHTLPTLLYSGESDSR